MDAVQHAAMAAKAASHVQGNAKIIVQAVLHRAQKIAVLRAHLGVMAVLEIVRDSVNTHVFLHALQHVMAAARISVLGSAEIWQADTIARY